MFRKKWIRIPLIIFTLLFAVIGFGLTAAYVAIEYGFTNQSGDVDHNHRYFQAISDKYKNNDQDSTANDFYKYDALNRILILKKYHPKNANSILQILETSQNEVEVLRMLDAVDLLLKKNAPYMAEVKQYKESKYKSKAKKSYRNVFEWMNTSEWADFKIAVEKDKELIDSVSRLTGVESRLIVSCLVGEQIRLFNSDREAYKKWIGPLKILSVESKFSLGVTGIKDLTAQKIEGYLKDSSSVYYIGKEYEHLLDFKTTEIQQERFDRLTSFRNHFYSYMYAAVFLKQVKVQWERAGYPIAHRPEILATLFNVGFPQSVPKSNPKVGGSTILIKEKPYTFGAIAYQFYYSGELYDLFPFEKQKFDWDEAS